MDFESGGKEVKTITDAVELLSSKSAHHTCQLFIKRFICRRGNPGKLVEIPTHCTFQLFLVFVFVISGISFPGCHSFPTPDLTANTKPPPLWKRHFGEMSRQPLSGGGDELHSANLTVNVNPQNLHYRAADKPIPGLIVMQSTASFRTFSLSNTTW